MIYTSYWGNVRKLTKAGIEPVAICRGKPKWFNGRAIDSLAPTYRMMRLEGDEFAKEYSKILRHADADEIVGELGGGDVALMCWEKDDAECHRSQVAEWLRKSGYECEEFTGVTKDALPEILQLCLF